MHNKMEGTNNSEMINEMITELNTPTHPDKNAHLIVGEEYKITGGKYKKHKTCRLEKINDTYSDVSVKVKQKNIVGEPTTTETCKVKNAYLLRLNPPGIDMPEADDLQVVESLDKYFEDNPNHTFAPKDEEVPVGKKEMVNKIMEKYDTEPVEVKTINGLQVVGTHQEWLGYELLKQEHELLKERIRNMFGMIKLYEEVLPK